MRQHKRVDTIDYPALYVIQASCLGSANQDDESDRDVESYFEVERQRFADQTCFSDPALVFVMTHLT